MPVTKRTLLNRIRSRLAAIGRKNLVAGIDTIGNLYIVFPDNMGSELRAVIVGNLRDYVTTEGYYLREVTDALLHVIERTPETIYY